MATTVALALSMYYCTKIHAVPLAEVHSGHGQVGGVEGGVDGVVQMASAVVPSQSQIAAGGVVDAPLPHLPAVLGGARAEGFFHLLIPVGAVAVAVVSSGGFEVQPLQGLLHATLNFFALRTRRRGRPGLYKRHGLLSGRCHGCLGGHFPTINGIALRKDK